MQNKLKIALIGPIPPPAGGIASWTLRMLHSDFASRYVDFVHIDESVIAGREIYGREAKRSLSQELKRCFRIWGDLRTALKGGDVDAVHASIPAAPLSMLREIVCASIANRFGVPFIIHFRCTIPNYVTNGITSWLLGLLLSRSEAAIVLNRASEKFLNEFYRTPTYLVPNFVSSAELEISREALRTYDGPLRSVLYTGGIIESKGAFDILKIARELPNIEFRLAGKGDFPSDIPVPSNVVLLGQLSKDAILDEYGKADAFLFLSRFKGEGFSNSLVEAMSAGLPCVVTDWAANADMIGEDGGFVVDYHDLGSVVGALEYLNEGERRREMGSANSSKAAQLYSEETVISKYIDLYRAVAGER